MTAVIPSQLPSKRILTWEKATWEEYALIRDRHELSDTPRGREAASPDLALYVGADRPQWAEGETRKINLDRWRVPNLVGGISDTTLASDLDQKKKLYAALVISEYWVIDVRGRQVFFFCLEEGQYYEVVASEVLPGLTASLLEQAFLKLGPMTNMDVALWFQQQISKLSAQ